MGIEMEWNQFLFKELTQIYEEITLQVHFYEAEEQLRKEVEELQAQKKKQAKPQKKKA